MSLNIPKIDGQTAKGATTVAMPHSKAFLYAKARQTRANIRRLENDILKVMAHPDSTIEQLADVKKMYEQLAARWADLKRKLAKYGIEWKDGV